MFGEEFKKDDIIEFCGETYVVLENYGNSGRVIEYYNGTYGDKVGKFYWEFQDEKCILVGHIEKKNGELE